MFVYDFYMVLFVKRYNTTDINVKLTPIRLTETSRILPENKDKKKHYY